MVEGATLGGRIIGRHLRDGLGLNASTGASFFAGYGEQTGAMWTRLTAHVDAAPFVDTEEAASAAVETFETLLAWFSTALSSA